MEFFNNRYGELAFFTPINQNEHWTIIF
jgi:hypothetical protein